MPRLFGPDRKKKVLYISFCRVRAFYNTEIF